jgi:hypothetical protein
MARRRPVAESPGTHSCPPARSAAPGLQAPSGTYAVQLPKASGAKVTDVVSTAKADLVRSIGADDVIDYTRRTSPTAVSTMT